MLRLFRTPVPVNHESRKKTFDAFEALANHQLIEHGMGLVRVFSQPI